MVIKFLNDFVSCSRHPTIFLMLLVLLQGAVKVMAKDLVRTRHQIEKFYKLKSQLQGVSLRIQVIFSLCISSQKTWAYMYEESHSCSWLFSTGNIRYCFARFDTDIER